MSRAWQHFTSWCVYPAVLVGFVILLAAPAFGVSQFWDGLLLRLLALASVVLGGYDRRVRTPRRLEELASHRAARN